MTKYHVLLSVCASGTDCSLFSDLQSNHQCVFGMQEEKVSAGDVITDEADAETKVSVMDLIS